MKDFATTAREILIKYDEEWQQVLIDPKGAHSINFPLTALVAAHEADKREAVESLRHAVKQLTDVQIDDLIDQRLAALDTPEEGTNE